MILRIDLTGQKFNRLLVISRAPNKGSRVMWNCICDCGNQKIIDGANLRRGKIKSCGCFQIENGHRVMSIINANKNCHGYSQTPTYQIWRLMRRRCSDSRISDYSLYGGRGITVCDRWQNSFENFLEDIGERPSKDYSIDRIDSNGNYEPSNCRWATAIEQGNNKRSCVYISDLDGEVLSMKNYCRKHNLYYKSFKWYFREKGLSLQEATKFTRPGFKLNNIK